MIAVPPIPHICREKAMSQAMGQKLAMALVSSMAMVGVAFANAGPPRLPKGYKVAEPSVRFTGTDKCADHVFYLNNRTAYFDFGHGLVEVKGSEPITLAFKTKDYIPNLHVVLLAVERRDFEKRKKEDVSLKWLIDEKYGVLSAKLTPPETTASAAAREIPVTTYRVTLKEGKLSAEKAEQKKSDAGNRSGSLPPWILGIVSSLSIAWLGIWFARRDATPSLSR